MNAYEKQKLEEKKQYDEWKYGPPVWRELIGSLNPDFDPNSKALYVMVTESMEQDNFYDDHTREECAVEWRERYETYARSRYGITK